MQLCAKPSIRVTPFRGGMSSGPCLLTRCCRPTFTGMKPTITGFATSPDRGRGLARDMRVRWALEEVGQPYDVSFLSFSQMKEPEHLARHPFGQIPTYQEPGLTLFESGAIVLHIAETHDGLMPQDTNGRIRAISWMFAALNTVEPPILELETAMLLERNEDWHDKRLPGLHARITKRLNALEDCLADKTWLESDFSAGDLMMVSVLMRIGSSGLLEAYPELTTYMARAQARPAYKQAFAAQLAVYEATTGTD